jgi:Na+/H+-dicarboxylate symporter
MKLHTKILVGLVAGLAAGIAVNRLVVPGAGGAPGWLEWIIANVTDPVGQVFLRLLFMIVVPLVFASLSLGVANLQGTRSLGRVGLKTLAYFVFVTALAVLLGLLLIDLTRPGKNFDPAMQSKLMALYGKTSSEIIGQSGELRISVMTFVDMILPRNILRAIVNMEMLPVIVAAFLFGWAMTRIKPPAVDSLKRGLAGLNEFSVRIVDMAMQLAPYAVPCLIFSIGARFGFSILKPLALYVILVFTGYLIHLCVVYSILLRTLARVSPWQFFRAIKPVMITAFSTSSSNATLPTTIRVSEEELRISPDIAGFVLPLGATTNMNGTALYEGVTVLFLAQVFGIDLSIGQQALVLVMTVMTAIGTAGVPGGSLPMVIIVMQAVGVPAEGIGIILGVDRILDMGRTVLNVTGDMTAAAYVARSEGQPVRFND